MTDAELIGFCRDFRHGVLGQNAAGDGACAIICWPLASLLRISGVDAICRDGEFNEDSAAPFANHVWLELPDGRVLDPTFDQFCSEEPVDIYLGPPTEFHPSSGSNPCRT